MKHFIKFFIALQFAYIAGGATCFHSGTHTAVTFLLVDRTDLLKDEARFSQVLETIREGLHPSERFMAAVITDHANSSRLMIDMVKPEGSAWKSVLKSRKEMKGFDSCIEDFRKSLFSSKEHYKESAILETLAFASEILKTDTSARKRVVLYSDMLQNSELISFYKDKSGAFDVVRLLRKAKEREMVKSLAGSDLYFVTNSRSLGEKRDREVEKFWREYAKTTTANFKLYGPVLTNLE